MSETQITTIFIGTDHAGFELKEAIKAHLESSGYEVEDLGAHWFDAEDDYPDFIRPVAEAVAKDTSSRGIIMGGSGQGEAICANRVKGIRAVVYYGGAEEIVRLSRSHNNANILSFGARFISEEQALTVLDLWLSLPFEGDRHKSRIDKLDE
ncbi:MAG: RpiB/LacA/LacB family sugar-phosphate isomerase [Candidatus Marinimicrobia bacterium]|nr:RpiB/LacA/LacB family sugar-phosphate isomerase [Candidatus Neomarinimicrobiota bacterium]